MDPIGIIVAIAVTLIVGTATVAGLLEWNYPFLVQRRRK